MLQFEAIGQLDKRGPTESDEEIQFRCLESHSFFAISDAVSSEVAEEALEEFFLTAKRPSRIAWNQV